MRVIIPTICAIAGYQLLGPYHLPWYVSLPAALLFAATGALNVHFSERLGGK